MLHLTVLVRPDAFAHSVQDEEKWEEFIRPLDDPALWTALHHSQTAPFVQDEMESFGFNQPGVRRSAWAFLLAVIQNGRSTSGGLCDRTLWLLADVLFSKKKPQIDHVQSLLPTLSAAALRSAWVEPDSGVRGSTMWQSLLTFLKGV